MEQNLPLKSYIQLRWEEAWEYIKSMSTYIVLTVCIVSLVRYNLTWRNLMEGFPFGPTAKYGNSSGRGIYSRKQMILNFELCLKGNVMFLFPLLITVHKYVENKCLFSREQHKVYHLLFLWVNEWSRFLVNVLNWSYLMDLNWPVSITNAYKPLKSNPSSLIHGRVHFIWKHFVFPFCTDFLQPVKVHHN